MPYTYACFPSKLIQRESTGYIEDIWIEVAKHLESKDLIRLAMTNSWFYNFIKDDIIWNYAVLRDLEVSVHQVSFKWFEIYASAFDEIHAFCFHQKEKHIAWDRLGTFVFETSSAVLTDQLALPGNLRELELEEDNLMSLYDNGVCILKDIRIGVWIAGGIRILDVRHVELFLEKSFIDGSWQFEDIGNHKIEKESKSAFGAIFDYKHINSPGTAGLFNTSLWSEPGEWHARTNLSSHAVAFKADLQPKDGRAMIFQAMKSKGSDEKVVSIRILHHLYGRNFEHYQSPFEEE